MHVVIRHDKFRSLLYARHNLYSGILLNSGREENREQPARLLNIGTLNGRRGTYQIRAARSKEEKRVTIFNNTMMPRNRDMIVL